MAIALALAVSNHHTSHEAAAAVVDETTSRSHALATGTDAVPLGGEPLGGQRAAVLAGNLSDRIPVPAGGNFNGIQWKELEGTLAPQDVQAVLEYNAACQWYRALRDGRQSDDARAVIADVPRWPETRSRGTGELAAAAAAAVLAGGGDALTGILGDCDAAHAREIAYARNQRLPPPG